MTVPAFPVTLPTIVEENVFAPATVWSPVVITAPAAVTFAVAVTSAPAAMAVNLFLSAVVIIAPLPTLDTSLKAVTEDVV